MMDIGFLIGFAIGAFLAHRFGLPMFWAGLTVLAGISLFSWATGTSFNLSLYFTLAGLSVGGLLFERKAVKSQ